MIRTLEDLEPHHDETGIWFALREVCELLRVADSRRVTRHIVSGHMMWRYSGSDWRTKRRAYYIDCRALIEVCRAIGPIPNHLVRDYTTRQRGNASQGIAMEL